MQLTIDADGSSRAALIGASPFPRHWLYDDAEELVQKSALTRNKVWARTAFGTHTPWGGEDNAPDVAEPETGLERVLADLIMQQRSQPAIRHLRAGDYLFRTDEQGTSVALILDGVFEVRVEGRVVGHAGPGTVVGERAHLESGRRTADMRATTDARAAEIPAGGLDLELLAELAQGHHREDSP